MGVTIPEDTVGELVRRAREIIAGREQPLPIIDPLDERGPSNPSVGAGRWSDWLTLQAVHGGEMTACFTSREGVLVVLARGPKEVRSLLDGLTDDERVQVTIEFPDPPLDFVPTMEPSTGRIEPDASLRGRHHVGASNGTREPGRVGSD